LRLGERDGHLSREGDPRRETERQRETERETETETERDRERDRDRDRERQRERQWQRERRFVGLPSVDIDIACALGITAEYFPNQRLDPEDFSMVGLQISKRPNGDPKMDSDSVGND
jgi:hypothetical protein